MTVQEENWTRTELVSTLDISPKYLTDLCRSDSQMETGTHTVASSSLMYGLAELGWVRWAPLSYGCAMNSICSLRLIANPRMDQLHE
jgi:hypothetical protein